MAHTKSLFGWKRLGPDIEAGFLRVILDLIGEGQLSGDDERLTYTGE